MTFSQPKIGGPPRPHPCGPVAGAASIQDANRQTLARDNLGNEIRYVLDALGNRTKEDVFDATNTLKRTLGRLYNNLNRLISQTGGAGQLTQFGYDPQGNQTSVSDPKSQSTTSQFDALNRLVLAIDPQAPTSGQTGFEYNSLDQLEKVTDPRGLETPFAYNAFGEVETAK